jgi:hypothetical protein
MGYQRVIPRDLFNEASLLKCVGRLSLLIHNRSAPPNLRLEHFGTSAGFQIYQDPDDGSIAISNISLFRNNKGGFDLWRPLNSRDPWPLYVDYKDNEARVFDHEGNLSPEFIEWSLKP